MTGEHSKTCILCEKYRDNKDEENLILLRGRSCYVLLNLFPYNPGHLMIVPYQHRPSLEEVDATTLAEMMELLTESIRWLRTAMAPAGFNIGINIGHAAGAGLADHLHMHVVPRWEGDTNFMPVLADTKTMPEALSATYAKLVRVIDEASP